MPKSIRNGVAWLLVLIACTPTPSPNAETPRPTAVLAGSPDHHRLLRDCLAQRGVAAAITPQGALTVTGQAGEAVEACRRELARSVEVVQPDWSDRETRRLTYRALLDTYRCLQQNGYPTREPPSEEAYVEGTAWHPYDAVGGIIVTADETADTSVDDATALALEAQQTCPVDLSLLLDHTP